jgi:hypothetical protein
MWQTQSGLFSMWFQRSSSGPPGLASLASPEVMVNNCSRVTRRSRGSALGGRWVARSSPTVWSRLFNLWSARAMPTSADVTLLVTEWLLWPSLASSPCQ